MQETTSQQPAKPPARYRVIGTTGLGVTVAYRSRLDQETEATMRHAIAVYGFLVARGESLSGEQWCTRIRAIFAPSRRIDEVCAAIDAAMKE